VIDIDGSSVVCTAGHRFFVPDSGWVRADELTAGQPVRTEPGETVAVSRVDRVRLGGSTTTYDLSVGGVENYFVGVGRHWVLVHNGGDDDKYNRTLYWHFDKVPTVRDNDVDGLSVWKTESRDDVNKMMDRRVNKVGRKPNKDQYLVMTPEQVESAGLKCPETPSKDKLATEDGLKHHSLRPGDVDENKELSEAEMADLQKKLDGEKEKWEKVKPKDVTGCDDYAAAQGG
jgi:hypothetical protein